MSEQDRDPVPSTTARFDLSARLAVVEVRGHDAGRFLQSQLSCEVARLGRDHAAYGAYLSPQGRVLATLVVVPADECFLLLLHPTLVEAMVGRLRRYVLRDDVRLLPLPELHVSGAGRSDWHAEAPNLSLLPLDQASGGYAVQLPDGRRLVISARAGGEPDGDWWRAGLQQGIAWIEAATSDRHIPQALGLDRTGAVSFTKGCYPGQEIVARVHYLGRAKRGLRLLRAAQGPAPAAELVDGDGASCGEVVDAAPDRDGCLVLAVVTADAAAPFSVAGQALTELRRFEAQRSATR